MKEHQHIEWKESWRDDALRSICGFANADGGVLVIGRNDRGEVTGIGNARRLLQELPNKVRDLLGIMVDVNLRSETGREYLEITVPAYPNPISYRGEYYYRSGSTTQTFKGAALDQFLLRRQGRHWDGVPVPDFSMADLSAAALAGFRKRAARSKRVPAELLAEADDVMLNKLRLFEKSYLKRAALLLFLDDPERLVTGAYVKIGYFRTDSDLRYQDEIHGDLMAQVDRTLDLLLTKYLRAWISYEGVQRVETYPIPEPALREALINAIAHKDYASNIPIQISVYDTKLMIWNPGHLPPDWTLDELTAKHASVPYNPDIASVFFRAALLESWGRGIDLIRDACAAHGSPMPEFRWDNGLWVELPFMAVATQETTQETTQ
ncbi:MAG TPA: ATP-binding protein, partial [Thermoanaerobaculia bacterium]|nr:ATP-binding protein [Thermoanaerobaculia bacterium]